MDNKDMEQQINEIDDLLDIENDTEKVNQKDIAKKIKKKVGKRVFAQAFLAVIVVLGIGVGLYFGSSKVLRLVCYDPTKEKELLDEYNDEGAYQDDFNALLNTYAGLIYPGTYFIPYYDEKGYSRGFGKYVYRYKVGDCIDGINFDGTYNCQYVIKRNHKSEEESYGPETITLETFYNANVRKKGSFRYDNMGHSFEKLSEAEHTIEEIKKLPDSTYLLVNASFENVKTADEAVDFMRNHPEAQVTWVAVDDPYFITPQATPGISLQSAVGYFYNEETLEKYPNLDDESWNYDGTEDFEQHDGSDLQQLYLSRLKLLIDHEEFVEAINLKNVSMQYGVENMKQQYENVSQNGIDVIGVQIEIQKQDLLKLIEDNEIQYLDVKRLRLSWLTI